MTNEQITVGDCEEMCDRLLEDTRGVTDKVFLWRQAWLRLAERVGQQDPMLPPRDPNAPDTAENMIRAIRDEMYALLDGRTTNPRACMKAFDRINDVTPPS